MPLAHLDSSIWPSIPRRSALFVGQSQRKQEEASEQNPHFDLNAKLKLATNVKLRYEDYPSHALATECPEVMRFRRLTRVIISQTHPFH